MVEVECRREERLGKEVDLGSDEVKRMVFWYFGIFKRKNLIYK